MSEPNSSCPSACGSTGVLGLQHAVERALRQMGYEICGDDEDEGWYWRLEDYDSRTTRLAEDSIEQATVAALTDLVSRVDELHAAAARVATCWETGDLAEAVRELDACVRAMKSSSHLESAKS